MFPLVAEEGPEPGSAEVLPEKTTEALEAGLTEQKPENGALSEEAELGEEAVEKTAEISTSEDAANENAVGEESEADLAEGENAEPQTLELLQQPKADKIALRIYVPPFRGILTANSKFASPPPRVRIEGGPDLIHLNRNNYSETIFLDPGQRLKLMSSMAEQEEELYAELALPETFVSGVIVLDHNIESGQGEMKAYEVNPQEAPAGGYLFINELEDDLELHFRETQLIIPAGGTLSLEGEGPRERFFLREQGGKRRGLSAAVYCQPGRCTLNVIRPLAGSERRLELFRLQGLEVESPEQESAP